MARVKKKGLAVKWEQLVPKEEIQRRIQTLQKEMQEAGIQAALVIQRVDLFYLTGTAQNAYLFIPASGASLLMVKKYYPRARQESPLEQIVELKSVKDLPAIIKTHYNELPASLGLEMDVLPFREFQFLQSMFRAQHLRDISPLILKCRATKSTWEIEQFQVASMLSKKCFRVAVELIAPQKNPIEVASHVQALARRLGHGARIRLRYHYEKALPFTVNFLCSLDHGQGLTAGNCLAELDFKWVLNGYHLLEGRLLKLMELPPNYERAFQALAEIHDLIVEQARPGIKAEHLYRVATEKAKSLGYEDRLAGMDMRDQPSRLAPLGHGIGLELREPPRIIIGDQTVLCANMVLTIRPAVLAEENVVISISSVIRINEKGSEYLSKISEKVFDRL